MNVILLKSQMGVPVYVVPIKDIRYGPFQLCLSTYNEKQVPAIHAAAKDFRIYIQECYRKQYPVKPQIITGN